MTTWTCIEVLWLMHSVLCKYNIAFTGVYSVPIMQWNLETFPNKSTQYTWQHIVTVYSKCVFSRVRKHKFIWTDAHGNTVMMKGHIFTRYSEEGTHMQPLPPPSASPYPSASPLHVALPQTCISVRWPCFNVCWKGRSGPVHWFRKALLGLYAWLRFSVIPPDTGDIHCLHHWHPSLSLTHTHVKKTTQNTKSKAIARLSGCQT